MRSIRSRPTGERPLPGFGYTGSISAVARHVWTARRVQVDGGEIWRRFDCGHVSGFFVRSMTASPDGFREWHSKTINRH